MTINTFTRNLRLLFILIVSVHFLCNAQVQDSLSDATLPKFDVPEFDITGKEIIALPSSSKPHALELNKFDVNKIELNFPSEQKNIFSKELRTPNETLQLENNYPLRALFHIGRFASPELDISYGRAIAG